MARSAGDRLGPYEILSLIGKGGMGEVYRARDPRTGRDVAIKISADQFSERFDREVRAVASLNHPNICTLYDVGPNYLVMELVEGESPKGPLSLEETLRIASQIGAALEAAHEKGITHRDLKPGNIKIKPDGTVKVLDFGLAKQTGPAGEGGGENSPTLSMAATQAGSILGTAAYMSPEQARGRPVDKRADIWAFGVVMYELLTGQKLFKGDDITETLASVVKEQPDLSGVPASIRRLMQKCLEKDPKNRLRDIGDAMALVDSAPVDRLAQSRSRFGWIAAVLALVLVAGGLGTVAYRHANEEPPGVLRMSVLPPGKSTVATGFNIPLVSPDGKRIAFVATTEGKTQMWVRDLDALAARPLSGTEGMPSGQFWSPDSRSIGFFDGGKLKRIDVAGGPALTICETSNTIGASWGRDFIVIGGNGLARVPAAGGTPQLMAGSSLSDGFIPESWFLPDGRHFLFTVLGAASAQQSVVYVGDVESKDFLKSRQQVLVTTGVNNVYAQGHLLFVRDRTLMAQPFDARSFETRGDAVPVAEQLDTFLGIIASYSVSQNGVLVYTSGAVGNLQLTWYDRSGKASGTVGPPGFGLSSAISPDGSTVAFDRFDQNGTADVWLEDLARHAESRFTFGPQFTAYPVWSPDGDRVAFYSIREGNGNIYERTRGTGQEQLLHKGPGFRFPMDWSRDGQYIIEGISTDPKTKGDIWVLPLSGDKKPFVYLNSEFNESMAKLSPNGQWMAYVSDESRRQEIYLQMFPKPGGKIQVSTAGGAFPLWSRDGKELYYVSADQKLMAVEIKTSGTSLQPGVAKALFPVRFDQRPGIGYAYDIGKDGRFLIPTPVDQAARVPFTVVVNWTAGLKK